jgi:hypothetical protein
VKQARSSSGTNGTKAQDEQKGENRVSQRGAEQLVWYQQTMQGFGDRRCNLQQCSLMLRA